MGLLSLGYDVVESMAVSRDIKDGNFTDAHNRLLADLNDGRSPREHYDFARGVQALVGGNELIINNLEPGHVQVSMIAPEAVAGPYGQQIVNAQLPLADIYGLNCIEPVPVCGYGPAYCGPIPAFGVGCFAPPPYYAPRGYGARGYVAEPVVQNAYGAQVRNSTFAVPSVHAALQTIPHQHSISQAQQYSPRAVQQFTPRTTQSHFSAPHQFSHATAPAAHAEARRERR